MDNDQSNKKLKSSSSSSSSFGNKKIEMDNENKIPDDLFDLDPIPLIVSEDDDPLIHQLLLTLSKELRFEILFKLPFKSLCRFKCVPKSWQVMTQHPFFIDKVDQQSKPPFKWAMLDGNNQILIVTADRNGDSKTELKPYQVTPKYRFRYCQGIIGFSTNTKGSTSKFFLRNITTGRIIELKSPMGITPRYKIFELGFDPSLKKHIVLVGRTNQFSDYEFYVSTIEEGATRAEEAKESNADENRPVMAWRQVDSNVPQALLQWQSQEDDRPHFCCANGTLFWFIGPKRIMVSFNVANEQFRTVQLPQKLSAMVNEDEFEEFRYSLFEFEGYLCLVEQPSVMDCIVNLWLLKVKDIENNHWILLMKNKELPLEGTNLRKHFLENMDNHSDEAVRFFSQNGEILIAATDECKKYIFFYNFLSRQFQKIEIFGELGDACNFRVNNYVENYLDIENCGIFVEDDKLK